MSDARFRLARVLRLRTQLRALVQDEVALLGASLAALRGKIDEARDAQVALHDDAARALAAGAATGAELGRWGTWGGVLAGREAALVAESERVAEAIARGRAELLARRREERKLERLRDRSAARAVAEEARREALVLDELALRREREEGR